MSKKQNADKLPDKSESKTIITTEKNKPSEVKQADTPIKQKIVVYEMTKENRRCPIQIYHETDQENNITKVVKNTKNETDIFQQLAGTPNEQLAQSIINCGILALPGTCGQSDNTNNILQTLADFRPSNAGEARLSVQGAVLYSRAMNYFHAAECCLKEMQGADVFSRAGLFEAHQTHTKFALKLLQLHNETIETLNRLRRGNEQKIVVQHVNVNDGGKAIVTSQITGGGGEQQKNSEVPHGHITDM